MGTNENNVSVEQRTLAVVRLLKGEPAESLSKELGVDVAQLESWKHAFMSAGTRQLSDVEEVPTVEETIQMSREDVQAALGVSGEAGDESDIDTLEMETVLPETVQIDRPEDTAEPRKRGGDRVFSETAWFMAPVDEESVDSDGENVQVDEEKYAPKVGLTKEERRQYSLRSDDELEE